MRTKIDKEHRYRYFYDDRNERVAFYKIEDLEDNKRVLIYSDMKIKKDIDCVQITQKDIRQYPERILPFLETDFGNNELTYKLYEYILKDLEEKHKIKKA